jgi:hypothetical protein
LTFDDAVEDSRGRTKLVEYVHQFCRGSGLEDRFELLVFGARLARDKHDAITRYKAELTAPEIEILQSEQDGRAGGFWKQSKFFKATIATASLAGAIQGWTQRYACSYTSVVPLGGASIRDCR